MDGRSDTTPDRGRARRLTARAAAVILLGLSVLPGTACGRGAREAERAAALYAEGKYAEALPLLKTAYDAGKRTGTLVYQLGYCRNEVEKDPAAREQAWKEAEPLLETEISSPQGATLERLYYLSSINVLQRDEDASRGYARRAVEVGEKGGDPNALSGEDWFRLGRMHDFLSEASAAEAAYRRAVSAFEKVPAKNPAYLALSLVRVAEAHLRDARFEEGVAAFDKAARLLPGSPYVPAYSHGLALLAVGRFEEAGRRFAEEQDPELITEAQYGTDLARKAQEVAPLGEADVDGTAWKALPQEALSDRIKEAGIQVRKTREKYAWRAGEPLPAELRDRQKRFLALLVEAMTRDRGLQAVTLQLGVADLVRR